MTGSVSNRSMWAVATVVSMSILWLIFVVPATGPVSGGLIDLLTMAAAILVGLRATRSMAAPVRVPVPLLKSVL